jgi:thiol-disulfide isomerase/thioredoxin
MTSRVRYLAIALFVFGMIPAGLEAATAEPRLIAVKFHGDWCGSCKKMGPVFTDLQNKLDGSPILFVKLDLTNNTTKHQAQLMAAALGLSKTYHDNLGTGFILLIDGKTKQVAAKLTADMTLKQMAAEIQNRIDS